MRRSCTTALASVGVLMASLVVDCAAAAPASAQTSTSTVTLTPTRTATPTRTLPPTQTPTVTRTATGTPVACSAAEIIAREGATCPNNAGPCTITKAYVIADACILDFGTRAVTLAATGTLDINSGTVTLRAGSFTVAAGSGVQIDGRGNGTAPATTNGGTISIQTTGDVNVQKSGSIRARIDVSGDDQAGTIEILAGGTVTIAGRLNADGSTSAGSGGAITIRAGGDVIVPATSIISSTGGSLGVGGGDIDFGAGGNIDIGEVLDVRGVDAGSVTLTAGNQVLIRKSAAPSTILANGAGDGAVGGILIVTAGTSAQILGNISLQGDISAAGAGSGDGGTADIEATNGDLTLAANITASGASPDGPGGEVDLTAHGAVNFQSGTINASCPFSQGPGGLVTMEADLSVTSSGSVDVSGGSGGGEVDLDAGSFIVLNGAINASGDAPGSPGGIVSAGAGENGNGAFTVSNVIDVTGGPCALSGPCTNLGGTIGLTGCNLTIAALAGGATALRAGAPIGGEVDLTASEQLTVNGKVDASATVGSGTNGRNVFQYPRRKPPVIATNVVTPAAILSGRDTCTDLSQENCLIPCPTCGNGHIEFPETCDDGNTLNCDGCSAFCQSDTCDDGRVCTIDSCDSRLGCSHAPVPTPCIEPPTPTHTITPTATITPTTTLTPTPSNTATITPTRTPTATRTRTATSTPTRTPPATSSATPTVTRTATRSGTPTTTPTFTRTATRTVTPTATTSPTGTVTPTGSQPPTATSSPTPTPIEGIPGDGNCDGALTAADFTVIATMLGRAPDPVCPLADFNQDGIVDVTDLELVTLFEFIVFEQ
jgi:cysteine-rich repeat protein